MRETCIIDSPDVHAISVALSFGSDSAVYVTGDRQAH